MQPEGIQKPGERTGIKYDWEKDLLKFTAELAAGGMLCSADGYGVLSAFYYEPVFAAL